MIKLEMLSLERCEPDGTGATRFALTWHDDYAEYLQSDIQEELDNFLADLNQTYGAANVHENADIVLAGQSVGTTRVINNVFSCKTGTDTNTLAVFWRKCLGELDLELTLTFRKQEDAALFEWHYGDQIA